jgi:hypothetical protein
LIGSGTTLIGVVVGWLLQLGSTRADRRRRAAGRLGRIRRELTDNSATLKVIPSAPANSSFRLAEGAYDAHHEALAELLDEGLVVTIERAYSEVRSGNVILDSGRRLASNEADEIDRRISQALKFLAPTKQRWWRRK